MRFRVMDKPGGENTFLCSHGSVLIYLLCFSLVVVVIFQSLEVVSGFSVARHPINS